MNSASPLNSPSVLSIPSELDAIFLSQLSSFNSARDASCLASHPIAQTFLPLASNTSVTRRPVRPVAPVTTTIEGSFVLTQPIR